MKNDLVENNINLVHYIVHKFGNLPKDVYEEYFQEGCYWLILASERFDESKGFKFSTFAANYIYNGIRRYKRDCGNSFSGLKISRTIKDNISKINIAASCNSLDLESKEDLDLILDSLNLAEFEIPTVTSLDINVVGKDDSTLPRYDLLADSKEHFTNDILDCDLDAYLSYIRPKVSKRSYELISSMFKIYKETGEVDYTQPELAEMFGTSQANISRTRAKGLKLWKEFFK